MKPLRILILGASFGGLLGLRIAAAGHRVTFACREQEAALINRGKLLLRLPAKDHEGTIEIGAAQCPAPPGAGIPAEIDPNQYDLICLAMQEPSYSAPGVRELVGRIAASRIPCLSIMNMPLPPDLAKLAALDVQSLEEIYTEAALWSDFDPDLIALASADPQTTRSDSKDALIISVTLASNFKVAPFVRPQHQQVLQRLANDIDSCRIPAGGALVQPFVRLRLYESVFIPLVKWPMLITGNFRCITDGEPVSIAHAVCNDETESRELYECIYQLCIRIGAEKEMMVSFDRYLSAARSLTQPSSVARAIHSGASSVERADRLIKVLAKCHNIDNPVLNRIVTDVDRKLKHNRVAR